MASHSLRRILAGYLLVAIFLPSVVLVVFGGIWIPPQVRADIEQRQAELARAVSKQVDSYLQEGTSMVQLAAAMHRDFDAGSGHWRQLDYLLDTTKSINSIYLIDADGTVIDVALKGEGKKHRQDLAALDLSANPLFRELAQDGHPHWSKTFLSVIHGGLVSAYGLRRDGVTFIGEVDLDFLTRFLRQISQSDDSLIFLVDHYGQIVADNNGIYTAQQHNVANLQLVKSSIATEGQVTGLFRFAGRDMIGTVLPIPGVDWHILVARPTAVAYRTIWNLAKIVFSGVVAAFVAGLLASFLLSRKLALRFAALTDHARKVAKGDQGGEWPGSSIDEINRLSENLQEMARRIQDSELLYRSLFEQLPDGVVLFEQDSLKPFQFNAAACSQLGYSREEFAKLSVPDFFVAGAATDAERYRAILRKEGRVRFEAVHRSKTGERRHIFVSLQRIELQAQQPLILAIHHDVTDLKMAETERKNTHLLLDTFMKYSPVYTFIKEVTQTESRVLRASDNCKEVFGLSSAEVVGKTMPELLPAEVAAKVTADDWLVVSENRVLELEEEYQGRTYTSIKFPIPQESGNLLAGYNIDITDRIEAEKNRLQLEKQLLHAQKLESLGVLAGGIAHDFNNILMAITGNTEMALRRIQKNASPVDHLERIKQAADRAAALIRQLLDYTGKGQFRAETLDLNHLLEDSLNILEVSIGKKAELRVDLQRPLPLISADAAQIRQIIMNLVINAAEAIGDAGGVISMTTASLYCDKAELASDLIDAEPQAGDYVSLEVADSGCGMDALTMSKLFDPFFSTKFTGRGLGLAAVLGIIRSHRGVINVTSAPGEGTLFRVLLPVAEKLPLLRSGPVRQADWQGRGKVLLVDDEEAIRNIGAEMLRELGFSVLTCNDGKEALQTYRREEDIDFVILDLTMPKMGGEQCLQELKKINENVKVIISSGYNELAIARKLADHRAGAFLQKPYLLESLSESIRNLLG
ncbi:PAS domain S-box protein [Pelobacter seleniigenes]|uniref:PAS domain S-box protein n=1 Tax=Pelobacter seleniigenes TaxID=407188 RepID=UPI00068CE2BC|nr:PAS domain S-box protein [Pelobacter seleniigenes]